MKSTLFILPLLAASSVFAGEEAKIGFRGESAVFKPGETISFFAPASTSAQEVVVFRNNREMLRRDVGANVAPAVDVVAEAGACYVFSVKGEGAKKPEEIGVVCGIDAFRPATERPADFDRVWADEIAAMRRTKPVLVKKECVAGKVPGVEVAEIEVSFIEGLPPVTGWLAVPTNAPAKSLPIRIGIPGAAYCPFPNPSCGTSKDSIYFGINVHGLPNLHYDKEKWGAFAMVKGNYYTRESWTCDFAHSYYRKVILRLVRAADWLKTIPQWNGKDFRLAGGSQGGALSLIGAALIEGVTEADVHVPAMCDLGAERVGRKSGWPEPLNARSASERAEGYDQHRYLDVCHFAPRITCPVYVYTGMIDGCCAPSSQFAMFNALPKTTPRKLTISPVIGHSGARVRAELVFDTTGGK